MMSGGDGDAFMASAKAAYPNMSEEDLNKKLSYSSKTRDLAVRIYLEQIDGTDGEFDAREFPPQRIQFTAVFPPHLTHLAGGAVIKELECQVYTAGQGVSTFAPEIFSQPGIFGGYGRLYKVNQLVGIE